MDIRRRLHECVYLPHVAISGHVNKNKRARSPPVSSLFQIIFAFKTIDTAACVDEFLLAGKERMAFRTNFNAEILFHRPSFKRIAAGTGYPGDFIIRMDSCFHLIHLFPYCIQRIRKSAHEDILSQIMIKINDNPAFLCRPDFGGSRHFDLL